MSVPDDVSVPDDWSGLQLCKFSSSNFLALAIQDCAKTYVAFPGAVSRCPLEAVPPVSSKLDRTSSTSSQNPSVASMLALVIQQPVSLLLGGAPMGGRTRVLATRMQAEAVVDEAFGASHTSFYTDAKKQACLHGLGRGLGLGLGKGQSRVRLVKLGRLSDSP